MIDRFRETSMVWIMDEEDDLMQRSTKKVKTRVTDLNQPGESMDPTKGNDTNNSTRPKVSYRDSLLVTPGTMDEDSSPRSLNSNESEPNPQDRWYMDEENLQRKDKPFDPCPEIKVTKEEFDDWCKPWHASLIVKVLGKRESQRNQRPPYFGPWMMVKRQIRKKLERLIIGKKSIVIGKESLTVREGGDTKTGHLNETGSRYNILYEDAEIEGNSNTIHASEKQRTRQDEPRLPSVPKESGSKTQMAQRVLRLGAGKNPQNSKKKQIVSNGPSGIIKNHKPKAKDAARKREISTSSSKAPLQQRSATKNSEIVAMEAEMLDTMRRLQQEQNESHEVSKIAKNVLEEHVYERNKLVFDGANSQPVKVVEEIKSRCREYTKMMKKQGLARKMTKEPDSLIRWYPPDADYLKINVDGSFYAHNGNAACGGVVYDNLGKFVKGFALQPRELLYYAYGIVEYYQRFANRYRQQL
ncbi:hypothetical protein AHAS_Ahas19G0074600 [Arachis hypogaea]